MQQDDERLITTSMREQEDETEVTLRPRTLAEYYGQTQVKEMLSVFIQAAVKRHEPLDHLLLYGPPGLGKTTLACIIASEMGQNIRTTSGPAIERSGQHTYQPQSGRHTLYRRDSPPVPFGRGGALSRNGGFRAGHNDRQRPLGTLA